jgi:hypothetical protein
MKSRILPICLSAATMLMASSLQQPAFAFTSKAQASIWCAMIKIRTCHVKPQFDGFQHCLQWGTVSYNGGSVKCCMNWNCGNIN